MFYLYQKIKNSCIIFNLIKKYKKKYSHLEKVWDYPSQYVFSYLRNCIARFAIKTIFEKEILQS